MHRRRTAANHRTAPGTAGTLAGLAAGLLLAGSLTACGGVHRAWDCTKTAATVIGDIQDLKDTATNVGQVSDPSRRKATVKALDKVQHDLNKLDGRSQDSDVRTAVSRLSRSLSTARAQTAAGKNPNLGPVITNAAHLTDVCTPG